MKMLPSTPFSARSLLYRIEDGKLCASTPPPFFFMCFVLTCIVTISVYVYLARSRLTPTVHETPRNDFGTLSCLAESDTWQISHEDWMHE